MDSQPPERKPGSVYPDLKGTGRYVVDRAGTRYHPPGEGKTLILDDLTYFWDASGQLRAVAAANWKPPEKNKKRWGGKPRNGRSGR